MALLRRRRGRERTRASVGRHIPKRDRAGMRNAQRAKAGNLRRRNEKARSFQQSRWPISRESAARHRNERGDQTQQARRVHSAPWPRKPPKPKAKNPKPKSPPPQNPSSTAGPATTTNSSKPSNAASPSSAPK